MSLQLAVAGLGLAAAAVVLLRPALEERFPRFAVRAACLALGVSVILAGFARCAVNVRVPRPWDFPMFYTVARAAWEGERFYRPEVLEAVFEGRVRAETPDVPGDWLGEVGYWYLPPSALYWLPLGGLSFRFSLALHSLLQILCLFGAAWLLKPRGGGPGIGEAGDRRRPFSRPELWRFFETTVLVLAFRPTQTALGLGQLAPAALLGAALALRCAASRPVVAGLALAAGTFAKHLVVLWLVPIALACRWRALAAGIGFVALALVVAGVVLPEGTFSDYRRFGPAAAPVSFYVQEVNQSLLASCYRWFGEKPSSSAPMEAWPYPPFAAGALVLTIAAWLVTRRTIRDRFEAASGLWGIWALLLYPSTLFNTLPVLLLPLLAWRREAPESGRRSVAILGVFAAGAWRPHGGIYALLAAFAIGVWVSRGIASRPCRAKA